MAQAPQCAWNVKQRREILFIVFGFVGRFRFWVAVAVGQQLNAISCLVTWAVTQCICCFEYMVTLLQINIKRCFSYFSKKFLSFCARKCILLNWLSEKAHSITLWHMVVPEHVSLDFLNCASLSKDVRFHRMWDPFLTYMGLNMFYEL